jgi:hypothetical protein
MSRSKLTTSLRVNVKFGIKTGSRFEMGVGRKFTRCFRMKIMKYRSPRSLWTEDRFLLITNLFSKEPKI